MYSTLDNLKQNNVSGVYDAYSYQFIPGTGGNGDTYKEPGDLNQDIIRPRKYDALLFGEIIGRDLDFFPFWHSSQRNDPGLNIALYTNITVDKLLETARTTLDVGERIKKYEEFEKTINNDAPAIFIYAPEFIYVASPKIHNLSLGNVTIPSERFLDIHHWYIETERVWKIFAKE